VQVDVDNATNDAVAGLANVTYGGTLIVTNIGVNQLAGGETFQLFSASGAATGNFSSIVVLPATGVTNATFNPATGILTISAPSIPTASTNLVFTVSAGNVNLSWPSNYLGWSVQAQTNSLGTNWVTILGTAGVTATHFPIDPSNAAVFYRLYYLPAP
jgi:hypothetical protein